jgi:fatty acid desaturase
VPASLAELGHLVQGRGLFARDPRRYAPWLLGTGALSAAAVAAIASAEGAVAWAGAGLLLSFVSGQLALIGHDAAHGQVFERRAWNEALGLLAGNLGMGMSIGWWKASHTAHHTFPNVQGRDPNVDIGLVALTEAQARDAHGLCRFTVRHQALLFPLVLALEGFVMHRESFVFLGRAGGRRAALEWVLMTTHLLVYAGGLLLLLGPAGAALFIVGQKLTEGLYLGAIFAPNHKGMPILPDGHGLDFLSLQVSTTRNMQRSWLTDYVWGRQNYQIEHHLFPALPRHHVRAASAVVRRYCEEHGIAYRIVSVAESFLEIERDLYRISARWAAEGERAAV